MSEAFEDERGRIEDLVVGENFALTRISTAFGAVRGNHVHDRTTQWTYVTRGKLEIASERYGVQYVGPGRLVRHDPGDAHAWRAMEDSECLVLTEGPRASDFESDTRRLEEPLL